ncbi:MAG: exodeoxyribonuclease VII large subunit [Christensenellales bacterium]|jgi:exodeoxyribonuclease VII large subunit
MADKLTVSQLNDYVGGLMESDALLQNISVYGEISNYKLHYSGHRYFSLKDAGALVRCVMFKGSGRLDFEPKDGAKVIASGRVAVYKRDGQYQLYVRSMRQEGAGDLYEAFEKLKARLTEEGLFDASLKRPIPLLPGKIGVATSPTGAALRDILNIIYRRNPSAQVIIRPSKVQGDGAAQDVAAAISELSDAGADVIICGRGGGSIEDLWAFNEEIVARAIRQSAAPVISAVGHETDFTIADFAADLRAPTPSAAAELATPVKAELLEYISKQKARVKRAVEAGLERQTSRLRVVMSSRGMHRPERLIEQYGQTLDSLPRVMASAAANRLEAAKASLDAAKERLAALDVRNVMKRGFALVKKDGAVAVSAGQLSSGDEISIIMHDGEPSARVL